MQTIAPSVLLAVREYMQNSLQLCTFRRQVDAPQKLICDPATGSGAEAALSGCIHL